MIFQNLHHPDYLNDDYIKWRYTYQAGRKFIEQYLSKLSERESEADFKIRKRISYCPAFAKAAINEIKNSIYQRMTDIKRIGGSPSYINAISGKSGGVDRSGSTMNSFIGTEILPELLTMRKVGVYIDRPQESGSTSSLLTQKAPYLYYYCAEAIRSWTYDDEGRLTNVLLEETKWVYNSDLPSKYVTTFRKLSIQENDNIRSVKVEIFDDKDEVTDTYILNIPQIPFVIFELSDSLLCDVSDYQIALLNLASSDLGYLLRANVPFYIEQYNPNAASTHLKKVEGQEEVKTGATQGRQYPIGTNAPDFIHPSSEPLTASMNKQAQLKEEIRLLVQLSVANLDAPKNVSTETMGMGERTLEAGLSCVGLVLEWGENQINMIWAMYETDNNQNLTLLKPAITKYPEKYALVSNKDKRDEADALLTLIPKITSLKAKKFIVKRAVTLLIADSVTSDQLAETFKEIDAMEVIDDPAQLLLDVEAGIVDPETVSKARLYPEGSVTKAQEWHVQRAKAIAIAQSAGQPVGNNPAARGNNDLAVNKDGAKQEKTLSQDPSQSVTGGKGTK